MHLHQIKKPRNKRYILSLSFGNYLKNDGGTDKVICEHVNIFGEERVSYIQIAPIGINAERDKITIYTLVVDGVFEGVVTEFRLFSYLNTLTTQDYFVDTIFIHHLKKFKLRIIETILEATYAQIVFYIHDFYSICRNEQLLVNQIFCGQESPSETKCNKCRYNKDGGEYRRKVTRILLKYRNRLKIVAPSESALEIWANAYPQLRKHCVIIPHQKLLGKYHNKNMKFKHINLAYIGKFIPAKGSIQWSNLTSIYSNNKSFYNFFYFGTSDINEKNTKKISVSVDKNKLDSMVTALRNENIHIVIMWSIWPETYSYTYFEALAANCFVLTNDESGNICAMVRQKGNGKIFTCTHELYEYIHDYKKLKADVFEYWTKSKSDEHSVPEKIIPNKEDIVSLLSLKRNVFNFDCRFNLIKEIAAFVKGRLYFIANKRNKLKCVK